MRQAWYLHLCRRCCCWIRLLNIVLHNRRRPSTGRQRNRKRKRKRDRFPVCLFRRSQLSWVVRLEARQRNRHGRGQHKPPVRVCNVRHSSSCRDVMYAHQKISYFIRPVCAYCLQSHKCAPVSLRRGTVEHEYFSGLVQRCSANSMASYVTRLAPVFPLWFRSPSPSNPHPRLFPISRSTSSQQASLTCPYLVRCVARSRRSAGANGPDINELGDSDILRDIMNELPSRRPLLHCNDTKWNAKTLSVYSQKAILHALL